MKDEKVMKFDNVYFFKGTAYAGKSTMVNFCPNCGEKIFEGATFCATCGTKIE